jgi:NADH:ubiquinone oxidoreductase subunit K
LVGIVWNRKNFLLLLLCVELMFFSLSLIFIFLSVYLYNSMGQTICLLIITSAVAESAVGLSLLICGYRLGTEINYNSLATLRN